MKNGFYFQLALHSLFIFRYPKCCGHRQRHIYRSENQREEHDGICELAHSLEGAVIEVKAVRLALYQASIDSILIQLLYNRILQLVSINQHFMHFAVVAARRRVDSVENHTKILAEGIDVH